MSRVRFPSRDLRGPENGSHHAMTRSKTKSDTPEPVAEIRFPYAVASARLYDDGEYVTAEEGHVQCSEHGNITHDEAAIASCDHADGEADFEPAINVTNFVGLLAQDPDVQAEAVERMGERRPDEFVETVVPILEWMGFTVIGEP